MLTHEFLKSILHYNPESGIFTWIYKIAPKINIGSKAGTLTEKGYVKIAIKGKSYRANRLAWFYMTGEWPKESVDHKNRIRDDNSWTNLRDFTKKENSANSRQWETNKIFKSAMWSNGALSFSCG